MKRVKAVAISLIMAISIFHMASGVALGEETTDIITVGHGKDYNSISTALENAETNDIIVVSNGTYQESIVIDETIEIRGEYRYGATIKSKDNTTIKITSDNSFITGLNIISEGSEGISILVEGDSNEISYCKISGGSSGIVLDSNKRTHIHNNTIEDIDDHVEDLIIPQPTVGSYPQDLSPLAHWSFEESDWDGTNSEVRDSSGNGHHGALDGKGNPVNMGVSGTSATLGGNGRIFINDDDELDITGEITLSAWCKPTSGSYYLALIDKHHHFEGSDPVKEGGYTLYLDDGNARISLYTGTDWEISAKGTSDLRDGKWHHVLGTYDGDKVQIWVDGSLEKNNNVSRTMVTSSAKLTIGQRSEGWGGYMDYRGYIDEVSIFDSGLNTSQITGLYGHYMDEFPPSTPNNYGIVGSYEFEHFHEPSRTIFDTSGNHYNGVITSVQANIGDGLIGNGLTMDGGSSHMYIWENNSFDLTNKYTLSAWIKTSSTNFYQCIVDKLVHQELNGSDYETGYSLYLDDGRVRITSYAGDKGQGNSIGTTDVRDGIWHFVAGTYDGSYLNIYVDGKLEGSYQWANGTEVNDFNVGIGRRMGGWGGYMPFDGTIDSVKIFDRTLSYNGIKQEYMRDQRSGVRLSNSFENTIADNRIEDSAVGGISLNSSNLNLIKRNVVSNNGLGNIRMNPFSKENIIVGNSFITLPYDRFQAMDNAKGNYWHKSQSGNFWSNWKSPDSDEDGIVDYQYILNGSNGSIDLYPLSSIINVTYTPVIITANRAGAMVSSLYSQYYVATDLDTEERYLTWTMSTNATWLNFSSSQQIYGTPGIGDVGFYWVNITVSDGENSDWTNFTVFVLMNNTPSQPLDIDMKFGEDSSPDPIDLEELFPDSDIDEDEIEVESTDGIEADIQDGALVIYLEENWYGDGTVTITKKGSIEEKVIISIDVTPVNDAPMILDLTVSGELKEDENLSIAAEIVDIDFDELNYIWSVDGTDITSSARTFELTLPPGDYTVRLRVEDGKGGYVEESILLYIEEEDDAKGPDFPFWILAVVILLVVLTISIISVIILRKRQSGGTRYDSILVSDIGSSIDSDGSDVEPDVDDGIIEGHLDHPENKRIETKPCEMSEIRRDLKKALKEGTISGESYEIIMETLRDQK